MVAEARLKDLLVQRAGEARRPTQLEILELGTTNAAGELHGGAGLPAGALSIPARYIHTPS